MADKHPYATTLKSIPEIVSQFRKSFPSVVDAATVKKYGIAPKNETYLINILKYLSLIDDEGNRTELAERVFTIHNNDEFHKEFSNVVSKSYSDLFELYPDEAWTLDDDKLISFFRSADQSTDSVGTLQSKTFRSLAVLCGKAQAPPKSPPGRTAQEKRGSRQAKRSNAKTKATAATADFETSESNTESRTNTDPPLNLTLRIEINLPAGGDRDTYDHIFDSLRRNIIDGLRHR